MNKPSEIIKEKVIRAKIESYDIPRKQASFDPDWIEEAILEYLDEQQVYHVNPNCKDSTRCKPHGERGPVYMNKKGRSK